VPSFDSDTSTVSSGHGSKPEVLELARFIYRNRYVFVIVWPLFALLMAPLAGMLLITAIPMTKEPPAGSDSAQALAVFEEHFEGLYRLRRELVVFRCKVRCESAASDLSRGLVEEVVSLVEHFEGTHPGTIVMVNSYFTFAGHHQLGENPMLSDDRQSILVQWFWRVNETVKDDCVKFLDRIQEFIDETNTFQGPGGLQVSNTGLLTLDNAFTETMLEENTVHEIRTVWLPLIILALALQSPRMIFVALGCMPMELACAFGLVYLISLKATVLFQALSMMILLCTSLSFDYSLFVLTRYSEERGGGASVQDAIETVISQSGRVVVISGCVLMLAWASMIGLPPPFNTFCTAACAMILVCVSVQLTFVPSLLGVFPILGPPAGQKIAPSHESRDISVLLDQEGPTDPMTKAEPFMKGVGFAMGKWLTRFPFNIIIPLFVYMAMMPLTLRFGDNFDYANLKFKMGHEYQFTVPRGCKKWATAVEVQERFPSEVGVLMPLLIIATVDPYPVTTTTTTTSTTTLTTTTTKTMSTTTTTTKTTTTMTTTTKTTTTKTTTTKTLTTKTTTKTKPTTSSSVALAPIAGLPSAEASDDGSDGTAIGPIITATSTSSVASDDPSTTVPPEHHHHTRRLAFPNLPNERRAEAKLPTPLPLPSHNGALSTSTSQQPNPAGTSSPHAVDVRTEQFFSANCGMANALIEATKNSSVQLGAHNIVSATFHGEEQGAGGVKCLQSWEVDMLRTNPFIKRFFLTHTSQNLEALWKQLVSKKNDAMLTFAFPTVDPFDQRAFHLVEDVRGVLQEQTLESSIPGLTFKVFSPASVLMDLIEITSRRLPITAFMCVFSVFTLIAIWFGAPLLPLKLIMTVAVPITWTYGAALFVFQDGYLDWLGIPCLSSGNGAGIDWSVPCFSLTLMVGFAMDYEIFLIERIREYRDEGFGECESIQLGLAATGGTITCAGLIMALTFVSQLLGTIPVFNQMGFVMVLSILLDTFVIRTIMVPAMLSLFPRMNHWPSKVPPIRYAWLQGCSGGGEAVHRDVALSFKADTLPSKHSVPVPSGPLESGARKRGKEEGAAKGVTAEDSDQKQTLLSAPDNGELA
jgi:predicted RND superfamily exporter protein